MRQEIPTWLVVLIIVIVLVAIVAVYVWRGSQPSQIGPPEGKVPPGKPGAISPGGFGAPQPGARQTR